MIERRPRRVDLALPGQVDGGRTGPRQHPDRRPRTCTPTAPGRCATSNSMPRPAPNGCPGCCCARPATRTPRPGRRPGQCPRGDHRAAPTGGRSPVPTRPSTGALSEYLDRDVELRALPPFGDRDQYRAPMATKTDMRTIFGLGPDEPLPDLSVFPVRKLAEISRYATPLGSYVDAYPVHLLTEQSLRPWRHWPRGGLRRPTVPADAPDRLPRDTPINPNWPGAAGFCRRPAGCTVAPLIPTIRCVMPSHRQPRPRPRSGGHPHRRRPRPPVPGGLRQRADGRSDRRRG